MKTIKEINQEIDELIRGVISDKEKKRITPRVLQLRQYILYLETNPNPALLEKQISELEAIMKSKDSQFRQWSEDNAGRFTNLRSKYESLMGYHEMRSKIRALKYLLQ